MTKSQRRKARSWRARVPAKGPYLVRVDVDPIGDGAKSGPAPGIYKHGDRVVVGELGMGENAAAGRDEKTGEIVFVTALAAPHAESPRDLADVARADAKRPANTRGPRGVVTPAPRTGAAVSVDAARGHERTAPPCPLCAGTGVMFGTDLVYRERAKAPRVCGCVQ